MKNFKKTIAVVGAGLLLAAGMPFVVSADNTVDVRVRVEGDENNLYFDTIAVKSDKSEVTVADALKALDEQNDTIEIKGVDTGYITQVNDIAGGKYGGWDGWYYCVNGDVPMVGIGDYNLKEGDSVVLYYGGYPCQIPYADTEKISEGLISFKSNDMVFDSEGNSSNAVNPVTDAKVTVNGDNYTTNEKGEITIPEDKLTEQLAVQIEKKDSTGAPAVLRFEPDYVIEYKSDIGDTETSTETDTNSVTGFDSDPGTDSETDTSSETSSTTSSETSSNTSSAAASSTTSANNSSRTNTTNTTGTISKAAPQLSTESQTAQTGDGRIYFAVGVLAAAIIVGVIMLLVKKKED